MWPADQRQALFAQTQCCAACVEETNSNSIGPVLKSLILVNSPLLAEMESTEATENASPVSPQGKPADGPPATGTEKKTPFKESNPRDFMSPTDTLFSPCSQLLSKPKTRKAANSSSMPKKLLTQRMKQAQEESTKADEPAPSEAT
eukprot:scpid102398/ scgid33052/ 